MGQIAEGIKTVANTPQGKVVRVVATELSPIGDISRIIYEIDSYTREELSPDIRIREAAKSAIFLCVGKATSIIAPELADIPEKKKANNSQ